MKTIAQIISWLALSGTLLLSLLFFAGRLELEPVKVGMLVGTVVWFVATPVWMEHKATG